MNEKIEKAGVTMKEKMTEAIKKNPEVAVGAVLAGGMLCAYIIGEKAGTKYAARLFGAALGIYPKDATVGQFLEDLGNLGG